MFTYSLYGLAVIFLSFSFLKDKERTKQALVKAWKSLEKVLPDFTAVLVLVGLAITLLSPQVISRFIGQDTGFFGMLFTGVVGAVTLIPGFVAFPLADSLLQLGAGIEQVAVFVSTLMMVGVITAPLEIRYFGVKQTLIRNGLSFILAFGIAYLLGVLV